MMALYSVNLRIMGRPNIALIDEASLLSYIQLPFEDLLYTRIFLAGTIAAVASIALAAFLASRMGLGMRATGINPLMANANGVTTRRTTCLGIALANALPALSGAMFAQWIGFADISVGQGVIIIGLATVILGESLLRSSTLWVITLSCIVGSVVYRIAIAWALSIDGLGLRASDLNLVTAFAVTLALGLPAMRKTLLRMMRTSP